MPLSLRCPAGLFLGGALLVHAALALAAPASGKVDFAREVYPVLSKQCFSCHGPKRQDGGLRLDVRNRVLAGGDHGRTLVPGKAEESELYRRLVTQDAAHRMPLGAPALPAAQAERIRTWINEGAAWPDTLAGKESFREHWSFRPLKRPPVPGPPETHPVDAFIRQRLQAKGLSLSPPAERRTLLRRVHLDLTGLPPSPDEVDAFLSDQAPGAYERLVDRLLASPHFAERWGRHWLDLARFAESDGYENDRLRPDAWRFRDWVIDAWNRDLPFDQFTIEQLAGDLLPNATPAQRVAAGFHRNTLWNSAASADKEEFRTLAVKDRVDTTATAWMGLTAGCAKCHTHKYDPLTQKEYYQLYAFFNSTEDDEVAVDGGKAPTLRTYDRPSYVHVRGNFLQKGEAVAPGTPAFLPPLRPRSDEADRLDLARWLVDPRHPLTPRVAVNFVWQHLFGQGLVPTPENYGLSGQPPTHPELLDYLASVFTAPDRSVEAKKQGTKEEKASSTPPHFHTSTLGLRWSMKRLIRLIVTSAAYQQSSAASPNPQSAIRNPKSPSNPQSVDPENRLLWRQNRIRVEAEIVRDLALSASGLLDPKLGGPSIVPPFPEGLLEQQFTNEALKLPGPERHRRGVYIHVQRTLPHPTLAAFDGADGNQTCVRRDRTTTPIQALTLLNNPVFLESARALGERVRKLPGPPEERLRQAFRLCLSRLPTDAELAVLRELLETQQRLGAGEATQWAGVARTIFNLEEFTVRE